MRRNATITHPTLALALLLSVASALPRTASNAAEADKLPEVKLSLNQIIAYSVGVGYVAYHGRVDGNGVFRINVPHGELDDVLKSLIVRAESGSATLNVVNDRKRNESTTTDRLSNAATIGEILQQLRGIPIVATLNNENEIVGTVLAVELRDSVEDAQIVEREVLSLMSERGIVSVPLQQIMRWKVQQESIHDQLNRELNEIAEQGHGESRPFGDFKPEIEIEIQFRGKKSQEVTVGWLRTMPIWKPSYRLVDEQLQMWTTAENTTTEDWKNIDLSLVDGHPVAFRSPLYHTRFSHRNTVPLPLPDMDVPPELAESSNLSLLQSSSTTVEGEEFGWNNGIGGKMFKGGRGFGGAGGGMGGGGFGGGGGFFGGGAGEPENEPTPLLKAESSTSLSEQLGAADGPTATGADLHLTDRAVTIRSGMSRSAPSPELKIDSNFVSVFVESYHPHTPLRSVKVTNRMAMRLPAGPMTAYHSGSFIGDAMLPELAPDVPRIVSFGHDANIHVDVVHTEPKSRRESLTSDETKHLFQVKDSYRQQKIYSFENRTDQARTLIIQHPRPNKDWKVEELDHPQQATESAIRYEFKLKANETRTFEVTESREETQKLPWNEVLVDTLRGWNADKTIEAAVRDASRRVLGLRLDLEKYQARLAAAQRERVDQREETRRVAELLKNVPVQDGGTLRERYIKKLSLLEDTIERLESEESELSQKIESINQEL